MEKKTITYLSNNEKIFVEWWNSKPRAFNDYWESNGKMKLHHYIFKLNKFYHISFSEKGSIICSVIKNMIKGREKDIYHNYSIQKCMLAIMIEEKRA